MKKWIIMIVMLWAPVACAMERSTTNCNQGGKGLALTSVIKSGTLNQPTNVVGSYPSCTVTVYITGTLNLATLFADNVGTPLSNPFTSDATGMGFFYAVNGRYDVTYSGTGISTNFTVADVLLNDQPSGGNNPAARCFITTATEVGAQINTCVTTLSQASSGGVIEFLPGSFTWSTAVTLVDQRGIVLWGAGPTGTAITCSVNGPCLTVRNSSINGSSTTNQVADFTIRDLSIIGTGAVSGVAIRVAGGVEGSLFDNVSFANFTGTSGANLWFDDACSDGSTASGVNTCVNNVCSPGPGCVNGHPQAQWNERIEFDHVTLNSGFWGAKFTVNGGTGSFAYSKFKSVYITGSGFDFQNNANCFGCELFMSGNITATASTNTSALQVEAGAAFKEGTVHIECEGSGSTVVNHGTLLVKGFIRGDSLFQYNDGTMWIVDEGIHNQQTLTNAGKYLGFIVNDAVINSGTATLSSASAPFTSTMCQGGAGCTGAEGNKAVAVGGAGTNGNPLYANIIGFTSTSQVTISTNALTSVTGKTAVISGDLTLISEATEAGTPTVVTGTSSNFAQGRGQAFVSFASACINDGRCAFRIFQNNLLGVGLSSSLGTEEAKIDSQGIGYFQQAVPFGATSQLIIGAPQFNLSAGGKGVSASGGVLKYIQSQAVGCTTAASLNAVCTGTQLAWPGGAFADNLYAAFCTITSVTNVPVIVSAAKAAANIQITIMAGSAAAATGSVDCLGIHP